MTYDAGIAARYLKRVAIIYSRQSTPEQVRKNDGSRKYQQAQREHARRYGWPNERIVEIADDLGVSGMTGDRQGYQHANTLIQGRDAGGFFIADLSRGGRDAQEWFRFLKLMAEYDVLLFIDGNQTDTRDPSQVFVKQIEAVVVARENQMRTETMHRGRLGKVRDGRAVTLPPAGYRAVYEQAGGALVKTGRWIKDPDPVVQNAVAAVFRTFLRERSLARTVRALRAADVSIPWRRGQDVRWSMPTTQRVYRMLMNPAYHGKYIYGQKHLRAKSDGAV